MVHRVWNAANDFSVQCFDVFKLTVSSKTLKCDTRGERHLEPGKEANPNKHAILAKIYCNIVGLGGVKNL